MYFASITAAESHFRAIHSRQSQILPANEETDRQQSLRIKAKLSMRSPEVLCLIEDSATGGRDTEWLEEADVPWDTPEQMEVSSFCDEIPKVRDWVEWLANPFTTAELYN